MDDILRETYLYDFYGDLLTDHQKTVYEMVVLSDLSLAEAADECSISRQAVSDLLKRTKGTLAHYEDKLHLVERFVAIRHMAEEIGSEIERAKQSGLKSDSLDRIRDLTLDIIEEL